MKVPGDWINKDLTPQGQNVGHRIVKNMRIAGSGIYTYHRSELSLYGLDPIPEKYKDKQMFNIYRPPEVLQQHKDLFARIPIILGQHVLVDTSNAKQLAVGMTGDTVDTEVDNKDGELYLYTTGTIISGDGIQAYDNGGQLSCGYIPTTKWSEGTHHGVEYQAVLTGFEDVNHLLICKTARGGPQCMFMDSLDNSSPLEKFIIQHSGGKQMSLLDKLFGKRTTPVSGDAVLIPELLQSIGVGADPKVQVPKIRDLTKHLAGDDARVFNEYLDELEKATGETPEVMQKAVDIVADFYKSKLAGDANGDPNPAEGEDLKKEPPQKSDGTNEPAGDSGSTCPECKHDPCTCKKDEEKKAAGDSFDMNALVEGIGKAIQDGITKAFEERDQKAATTAGDNGILIDNKDGAKEGNAVELMKSWLS